ncbi:MAG TPA: glycosyltransferase family 39 protein, partial [Polyangiaceae bacterium]|nr:glycosyltransferase family 39 protein [Polyangiaceae bacterium]
WIVKQLLGVRAALLAALFLALSYLHVRDSHFGTVDVPLTFVATLALAMIVRARQASSARSNLLAGLLVGLAVSTKYNAVALLAPLLWCQLLQLEAAQKSERLQRVLRWYLPALVAIAVGFVLGTPYSVLDYATFSRDVIYELVDKGRSLPALDLGPGWLYHARVTLPHGVGLPLLLTALAGAVLWLRRDLRTALLLLGFPVAWYMGVGSSHYVFVRYVVPLAPALCIFAAYAVERFTLFLEQRWGAGLRARLLLALACSGLMVLPLYNVVQWNRLVRLEDTRVLAADWIERNVPSGQTVGLMGPVYMRPDLWSTALQMQRASAASNAQGRGLRNEMRIKHLERTGAPSYETRAFQQGVWLDPLNPASPSAQPPRYVVLAEHPAWVPEPGSVPVLSAEYTVVASFSAFGQEATSAVFDRHDAVYFPYARFAGVRRPGPNIRIFERQVVRP